MNAGTRALLEDAKRQVDDAAACEGDPKISAPAAIYQATLAQAKATIALIAMLGEIEARLASAHGPRRPGVPSQ